MYYIISKDKETVTLGDTESDLVETLPIKTILEAVSSGFTILGVSKQANGKYKITPYKPKSSKAKSSKEDVMDIAEIMPGTKLKGKIKVTNDTGLMDFGDRFDGVTADTLDFTDFKIDYTQKTKFDNMFRHSDIKKVNFSGLNMLNATAHGMFSECVIGELDLRGTRCPNAYDITNFVTFSEIGKLIVNQNQSQVILEARMNWGVELDVRD